MKDAAADALDGGVAALRAAYASGATTPVAVLDEVLARIAASNGRLNIVVHRLDDAARREAESATARWRAGHALPLDGVPVAVKANIAIGGAPWTAAIAAFGARVAVEDSFVVARLRAQGAVIVGIVNMHEAALGATNDSPLYGQAINPLKDGFTPGGSSGGSAAAVAAGYAPVALGTDTMGSCRIPAAYCGVAGFKPTYGAVSQRGVAPLSCSLDHVGVLGRKPADITAIVEAIAGFDADDPYAMDGVFRPYNPQITLKGLKLGRVRFEARVSCSAGMIARFDAACARLQAAGAEFVDIDLEGYDFARMRRSGLVVCEAEASAAMADALRNSPTGFSDGLRALLAYGANAPAERLAAIGARIAATRVMARHAFGRCAMLLLPTAPQTAFPHSGPAPANQADLTAFANFAGLPAASAPMGDGEDGMPTGLQIIGPPWADLSVLRVAALAEAALA